MASSSVDRTLRLWDLESFEQVCCMPPDNGQIRRVVFSEDGAALLSGGEESLRVWGWEPVRCYEQVDARWSRLADMCFAPGQHTLLGGSIREAIVAVWSVDMRATKPFANDQSSQGRTPVCSPRAMAGGVSPTGARVGSDGTTAPTQRTTKIPRPAAAAELAVASVPTQRAAHAPRLAAAEPLTSHTKSATAAISPARASPSIAEDAAVMCARQHIADFRAQLAAARRSSQGADASSVGNAPLQAPQADTPAVAAAQQVPYALSASGNHASVGTSMSDTLVQGDADGLPASALPPTALPAPAKRADARADAVKDGRTATNGRAASQPDVHVLDLLVHGGERQGACLSSRLQALRDLHTLWKAGHVKKVGLCNAPSCCL